MAQLGNECLFVWRSNGELHKCFAGKYCTSHKWIKSVPGYNDIAKIFDDIKECGSVSEDQKDKMLDTMYVEWDAVLKEFAFSIEQDLRNRLEAAIHKIKKARVESPLEKLKRTVNWVGDEPTMVKDLAKRLRGACVLEKSPAQTTSAAAASSGEASLTCFVCHADPFGVQNNPAMAMGCGHIVCFVCASRMQGTTCAVCSKPVQYGIKLYRV